MVIGFTGTREGMTEAQSSRVDALVDELLGEETGHRVIHGDAIGADAEFHDLMMEYREYDGQPENRVSISIMPAVHPDRAHKQAPAPGDTIEEPDHDPIRRNKRIVASSDVVIAAPSGTTEIKRGSGTWATIRHARATGVPLYIVHPDGEVHNG